MSSRVRPYEMDIITVMGSRFQQPIADLIDRLILREYAKPDRVGSNFYEGGYSASIIILLVAMLESMIQRNRYFFKINNPPTKKASFVACKYLHETLHYRRYAQIQELFELRNSVAHNHLWEVKFIWKKAGGREHKQSSLVPDTHRLAALPRQSAKIPRTKIVRFNLQPSRIDRTDVVKALAVANHLLEFLSNKDVSLIGIAHDIIVLRGGKRFPFSALVQKIRETF